MLEEHLVDELEVYEGFTKHASLWGGGVYKPLSPHDGGLNSLDVL